MSKKARENADRQAARRIDPLWVAQRLRDAATALDEASAHRADTVRAAREAGMNWGQIGRELGMTRQGARKQFGGS